MAFANAEELYKVWRILDQKLKADTKLSASLAADDNVTCLKIPNIGAIITMVTKGGESTQLYGEPPADLKIDATTINDDETFVKFWQGKLNLMIAMTKGQVKSTGSTTKMLKMLPKMTPVYKLFVEALKEAGREDLVIK